MKIQKIENGNVIIKNSADEIENIIATDVFLSVHPRSDTSILISKTASNQDTQGSILVSVGKVTSVNEESFSGTRNDLLLLLSELFNTGGADGVGSEFSGDYNDLINKPAIPINYVNTKTGDVVLNKSDIGLSNADNTSDINKPVSNATTTALNLKQNKLSLGGSIFCVWAEESADLGNGAFEWAYGNGNETPNGMGVVLVFDCELIGLGLTLEGNATCQVEAYKNTTATGKRVSTSNNKKSHVTFADTPIQYSAGDVVNFRTITGSTASNAGIVTAWFLAK